MLSQFNSSKSGFDGASGAASRIILAAYFVVYDFVKGWFLMCYSKQQCSNLLTVEHIHCRKAYDNLNLSIVLLLEVRPLSVSDTFDVSDTYLKIIIEPNRIILKFRFATIQIRQKIRCL